MDNIKLTLLDEKDNVLKQSEGYGRTFIDPHHPYALGDKIRVTVEKAPTFVVVQLDAALSPALLYLTENSWEYKIPFNVQREWPYPDGAFLGKNHYLQVRYASKEEYSGYRNLAVNSHDQHVNETNAFPHATANAETRGEMVFYAKNAIDGMLANESHGNYPYQSWGINEQDDAELKIEFGRGVEVDKVGVVLRADYPHDSHWIEATLEFSDGSKEVITPKKTKEEQYFNFPKRKTDWIKFTKLIKDKDMSTFPALTQLEVYGR
ncbi:hypothetical protein ACHLJU_00205 [Pediococcus acidilactici]|uniref:hypothetical protein n=1 Tax=Pediococcus acidilactici TaxID=1254 RepID=UPI003A8E64F2